MSNLVSDDNHPDWQAIQNAALDSSNVSGLTHSFYRYPARFSPLLINTIIKQFTEPGDLVLDPFVGGGTSLVEAMALGRRVAGSDISNLATFVTRVKTQLISDCQITILKRWGKRIPDWIDLRKPLPTVDELTKSHLKNLDTSETWRIRKAIRLCLKSINYLNDEKARNFARCVLLNVGQWALDGRRTIPPINEFRSRIRIVLQEMLEAALKFRSVVESSYQDIHINPMENEPVVVQCEASGINLYKEVTDLGNPKLIVTSPPYAGIHVLYHRWQVKGRRETPIPFLIADSLNGHGASHYTFGDRQTHHKRKYFYQLKRSFASIVKLCNKDTRLVQVVGFSNITSHLPKYLEILREVGFVELRPSGVESNRLWRGIPNRKWYTAANSSVDSRTEVVLVHRLKG